MLSFDFVTFRSLCWLGGSSEKEVIDVTDGFFILMFRFIPLFLYPVFGPEFYVILTLLNTLAASAIDLRRSPTILFVAKLFFLLLLPLDVYWLTMSRKPNFLKSGWLSLRAYLGDSIGSAVNTLLEDRSRSSFESKMC